MRGQVWLAELGVGVGREQQGRRPVVIVSDDSLNLGKSGLVVICPLTSKIAKSASILAHIRVDPPTGGLKVPSVILCDQVRAISVDRLIPPHWGVLDAGTLSKVETVVRRLLAL